ncbi:hypothetical protein COX97_03345 [Candidatus Pacearchaeota archaeon CG_4_10_14_0_2_um_filter_05_32_18]|nr:MAG: hypothetical protein COX97_03345 [Candidatus Pacearchaeota archaeon CG_4_10_14_0_2_um_filter_05_32_18]
MIFEDKFKTWRKIFSKPKYLLMTIIIALIFYSINVLIASWETVFSVYSFRGFSEGSKMFVNLFLGFGNTIVWHSHASLILIAFLLGMFFSLVVYRTKMSVKIMDKKGAGIFASLGVFLGVLAPGCAACGMGILSALGFGVVAVNFLPLKGLEISILSIAILGFSVAKITDKISNGNSCSIDLKGGKDE